MHTAAIGQFRTIARTYLDSASYGLPPTATIDVLTGALEAWATAEADWIADWDGAGDRCRYLVAPMIGAPVGEVSLQPAVSVGAAIALASVDLSGEILAAEDEFASILLPALAVAQRAGVQVRHVPFEALPDEIGDRTAVVLSSHVRSNDGRVQDLAALGAAAARHGTITLVDATHSLGVLPVEAAAHRLHYVVAAAYKHLLCPRGVAFLRVPADRFDSTAAIAGSWRSARAPYDYYYGPALADLAPDAARYDVSLAWHAWLGAEQSLLFLDSIPAAQRRDWCVTLATELAEELGVPATGSSVLAVPLADPDAARADLRAARVVGSGRGPAVRLSCHLYNDRDDVATATKVLYRHVRRAPNR